MNWQKSRSLFWILFFGVVWGITEATAGWVIHLFHLHYMTPFLIAIGAGCMIMAVMKTKSALSAFEVAVITSLIKMTNVYLLTFQPLSWVLAPVFNILLEGLLVTLIFYCLKEYRIPQELRRLILFYKRK